MIFAMCLRTIIKKCLSHETISQILTDTSKTFPEKRFLSFAVMKFCFNVSCNQKFDDLSYTDKIKVTPYKDILRALSNIYNGAFCKNSYRAKAVNIFVKSPIIDL